MEHFTCCVNRGAVTEVLNPKSGGGGAGALSPLPSAPKATAGPAEDPAAALTPPAQGWLALSF